MASRAKVTLWAERTLVALILASLAGALVLTISVYRRALDAPAAVPVQAPAVVASADPEPRPEPVHEPDPPAPVVVEAPPAPEPVEPPAPPAPQEDPTEKAVAELEAATAREIAEANRLDQRLRELEAAKRAAIAESDRWRRRDMLVKRQIAEMNARADALDRQTDQYAAERDVLARERDALKAAHAKADGRGSYAVLPYKGENGTWRRPIVLECVNGTVTVKPNGPTFNMLDLSGLINPRSSPIIAAIARELLKVQSSDSPDGAPVVPYFVFLVRPDGIRPYYEARARLEPLGVAFGYELIDQDLKVDVPDYDDLATWDGSPGTELPPPSALAGGAFPGGGNGEGLGGGSGNGRGEGEEPDSPLDSGLTWPGASRGSTTGRDRGGSESVAGAVAGAFDSAGGRGNGRDNGGDGGSPDDFIWSGAPGGLFRGAGSPGEPSPSGGGDQTIGSALSGTTDPSPGASSSGSGRQPGAGAAQDRGLSSAIDALPDFEPAEDPAPSNPGERGGSTLVAPPDPRRGFGSGAEPGEPRTDGAGAGQTEGDESGKGRTSADSANFVGLEPPRTTEPGAGGSTTPSNAPAEAGLMWGDGPSLAAGAVSEASAAAGTRTKTGTGNRADAKPVAGRESLGGSGSSSSSSPPSSAGDARGPGGGPRPLMTLGSEGEGGISGGGPPPPGLGVGLSSLGDLAGLLGGGASGGGTGASSGGSGLMIGSDAGASASAGASGGSSGSGDDLEAALAKRRADDAPASVIEVPFDITLVCGADGVTIQPGGYRITPSALRDGRVEKLLVRHLASVARRRAQVDPNIRPKPRVKFLVERDGGSTFWEARQQLLFADLNWPMSLQVAGGQSPRLFDREAWR